MGTPIDDDSAMAVLAGGLAATSNLQNAQSVLNGLLPGGGAAGGGWLAEDEEDEEGGKPKQIRQSYDRPNYWGSVWGEWLQGLRELSAADGGLDPECREARNFKGTFRVPYELFELIITSVSSVFPAGSVDVAGRECVPVELKVLGCLKVLASGCCFQDVAACARMSRTTAEASFLLFCEKFAEGLWDTWVRLPVGDELEKTTGSYGKSGFPGAMASVDCTHFDYACAFSEKNQHKEEEGHTTVVVEATCDHSGRIIAATKSYPGAENDKTVIARDKSIRRIRDEEPWKSFKYKLYTSNGTEVEHEGAWLIVDGGYPKIPLLIPPYKSYLNVEEHNWSKRLESIRKDIECCFGRIKGRWQLFKGVILFDKREKIDNAWFTACILHNMLHTLNRLGDMEGDADWVGSAGALEEDTGEAGAAMDVDEDSDVPAPGFLAFRQQLVTHFACAWAKKEVLWFRRQGTN